MKSPLQRSAFAKTQNSSHAYLFVPTRRSDTSFTTHRSVLRYCGPTRTVNPLSLARTSPYGGNQATYHTKRLRVSTRIPPPPPKNVYPLPESWTQTGSIAMARRNESTDLRSAIMERVILNIMLPNATIFRWN